MASFTLNEIQFTSVLKGQSLPNKYGNGNNGDFADVESDGVEPFINAVEIDWNGAKIRLKGDQEDRTIENTGQLLSALQDASNSGQTLQEALGPNPLGESGTPIYWTGDHFETAWSYPENATTTSSGLMSVDDKIKLESLKVLEAATSDALGGIKVGYTDNSNNYAVQLDNNNKAFVSVPWVDTTINATINTLLDNELVVTEVTGNNNNEKFKIQLTELALPNNSSGTIGGINLVVGDDSIHTYLPSFRVDSNNRTITYIGSDGNATDGVIRFGSLEIVDVLDGLIAKDNQDEYYVGVIVDDVDSAYDPTVHLNYPIYIGDLFLQQINVAELGQPEELEYHLFVCKDFRSDEDPRAPFNGNAYFKDLGVFPGNNVNIEATNINLQDGGFSIGETNISSVQNAIDNTLYYEVVSDIGDLEEEEEEEEDNGTNEEDNGNSGE